MLKIKNVSKMYGEGASKVIALDKVSFEIDQGDFVVIMGPSGSGKSTLLNIIGGLDRLSEGEVIFEGNRIDNLDENNLVAFRRGRIAYVFQQYHLLPSLTAMENVLLPSIFGGVDKESKKASQMLKRVGLEGRLEHKPGELSGGEQQRVAIARALVNNPLLVLADEPTGNMDRKTGKQIMGLFSELNKDGNTIVMVTHDNEVAKYAKELITLQDGQITDIVHQDR